MLKMKCPSCGYELRIPEQYRGQTGGCKHCNATFKVPVQPQPEAQRPSIFSRWAVFGVVGLSVVLAFFAFLFGVPLFLGRGIEKEQSLAIDRADFPAPESVETNPEATPQEYNEACQILKRNMQPGYDHVDAFWAYFREHNLDPNGTTTFGYSLLGFAIARGETEVVRTLIELGADVNEASGDMTPVARAAANNNLLLLKYLESQGADLSKTARSGMKPIEYAAMNGSQDSYEYLVTRGAISCPTSDFNDERFGFSEKMRKVIANELLFAEQRAGAVAEFYCPVDMYAKFREGDEVMLYQKAHLMPKLVEDDMAALSMKAIQVQTGTLLRISDVRKEFLFVKAINPETGKTLCAGWAYTYNLWNQACQHSGLSVAERLKAYNELEQRLGEYYDKRVRDAYQITLEVQEGIEMESIRESWLTPPFSTEEEKDAWIGEAEQLFGKRPPDFIERLPSIRIP